MNSLQIVLMVKNSGLIIKDVIKSWKKITNNFVILDTGSSDDTIKFIKSVKGINLIISSDPFVDFEYSRNKMLELSRTGDAKYSLIIDDSYFLKCTNVHTFKRELKFIEYNNHKMVAIKIYNPKGESYFSGRLVKTQEQLFYKGKIHEIIDEYITYKLESICISDRAPDQHIKRTHKRFVNYDIPMLMQNEDDPRNCYYLAMTYRILYNHDETKPIYGHKYVKYLIKRTLMTEGDAEEKFMCYVYLGDYFYIIKKNESLAYVNYSNAGRTFPSRAGEMLYRMYLLTGDERLIKVAKDCKLLSYAMSCDEKIYTETIPKICKELGI